MCLFNTSKPPLLVVFANVLALKPFILTTPPKKFGISTDLAVLCLLLHRFEGFLVKKSYIILIAIQFKCEFFTDQFCARELDETVRDVIIAVFE